MNATKREGQYYWLLEQPLSPASEGEATDRARSSITDGDKEEKQNRTKRNRNKKKKQKQTNKTKTKQSTETI